MYRRLGRHPGRLVPADGFPQDRARVRSTDPKNDADHLPDLRRGEVLMLVPLVLLFFVIGLFPNLFLDKINPSVEALVENPAIVMKVER